ncbi:MFS transporter [Candidatus Methylospira mobilis]|uniref:MFS transporter n=1 Tax=Candidatus Methylospira mobilis TaxID=1808979 RepID=A0A5Q0BIV6_9GAMM|nr:MFS transporter [Candidatus Methylospira mobilis]QFY43052.1 MFS transporter [Candidatus Methylospira mobilis]WNV03810.1 MFS transporter [Candidatus Methylospira mobilis]
MNHQTTVHQDKVAQIAARIERLPVSGFHRRFITLVSLGGWFDFYDIFMMAYLGAALKNSGFLNIQQFSLMISSGFLGMFAGSVLFGIGSDRFGRRTSFMFMLLIYSVFTLLGAFSHNAWELIALRFLAGLGIGAELVVIDSYVTEIIPGRLRGRYVAITQVVGFTAIPVVAGLSSLLIPTNWLLDGWRWVMVTGSAGAVLVWYLRRNLPESPRWCASTGRYEQAERIMRQIEQDVEREMDSPLPSPSATQISTRQSATPVQASIKTLWSRPYRKRTLVLTVFHCLQTVGIYGFANWAPMFMLTQGHSLEQSLDYGFWIALVSPLGPILCVLTTERIERKYALVILPLLMALSGITFPYAQSGLQIILTGAAITFFSYWFSAVLHAYQAEVFPTPIRATGVGFTYSISRLSVIASTSIITVLLQYGIMFVFAFIAACMMLIALLIGLFGERTNARLLEAVSN